MFAGTFDKYTSRDDMQNVHADLLNKEFKIKSNDISEFTTAQIQAKAAAMGLTDSLTTELIAMGKNAAFTQKAATGKLTFGKALKENIGSIEEIADVLSKSSVLPKDDLEPLIIPEISRKTTIVSSFLASIHIHNWRNDLQSPNYNHQLCPLLQKLL